MATSSTFHWNPARLLQEDDTTDSYALLILNQPLKNSANLRRLWKNAAVRVAADGGANRLHAISTFHGKFANLQVIIGDLDSLTPTVRQFYTSQPNATEVIKDDDQESSDFGKAVAWIRKTQPSDTDTVVIGGIGGRVDQGLSQLHHIHLFQKDPTYSQGRMYLLSGSSFTFLLKPGKHEIKVRNDGEDDVFAKYVGIIPLEGPSTISTKGLEWDVTNWDTRIGGRISTSNHILPETKIVEIETTHDVIFTVALRQGDNDDDA